MKTMLLSCVAGAAMLSAQAQLFSPDAITGAGLGAMIGGISGGDCHNGGFSGNDAAVGAGIGLLAGTLLGEARRQSEPDTVGYAYAPAPAPAVSFGYGYGNCGSSAYVYYSPNYYTAPGYYYRPAPQPVSTVYQSSRPNYAVGGTLLGAASGALIGVGSDQAGQGAAIGAGAGLVLGGIAEYASRKHEKKVAQAQIVAQYQPQPPSPVAAAPDTATPNPDTRNQITSTACPTSTYYWTTPLPQIPDASVVPDAPRF